MKVFAACMENKDLFIKYPNLRIKYGLGSFYSLKEEGWRYMCRHVDEILIDSGAHSLQHGANVNIEPFMDRYVRFVRRNTHQPRVLGFFEMDIDNIVGYEEVKSYRKRLDAVSDKIIPVWHRTRGIDDFYHMLETHKGRRVAITAFNDEVVAEQYNLFLNAAHKYGCTMHLLGCTKFDMLTTLNVGLNDSCDSSSWKIASTFSQMFIPKGHLLSCLRKSEFTQNIERIQSVSEVNMITMTIIQESFKNLDNSV